MSLFIAILLIYGLNLSPAWYLVACGLWTMKAVCVVLKAIAEYQS